jgi:hypothetical protein
LPTVAASERLIRLSPVRRLTLPGGSATARAKISVPSPSKRAFNVFVLVPVGADIGILIENSTGERLRVIDSTRGRECKARPPLRTCFLHFPRRDALRTSAWTIVLTKRSTAPAGVRVDVSFR